MDYTHNGVKIELQEKSGTFRAKIGDKFVSTSSLSAMKKRIDDAAKSTFKEFDALGYARVTSYSIKEGKLYVETYRVVGVEQDKKRYGHNFNFALKGTGETAKEWGSGEKDVSATTLDTPEARAAITNYYDIAVRNEKAIKALNDETEKARAAIPMLLADDFMKSQKAGGAA